MSKEYKAVFSPQAYTPALIGVAGDFATLWQQKRDWILSNMSHIAYFRDTQIVDFMNGLGANKTFCYDESGAQGFLAIWNSNAILAFRGSQPIENNNKSLHKLGMLKKFRLSHFMHLRLDPKSVLFLANDVLADLRFNKTNYGESGHVAVHKGFLGEVDKLWGKIIDNIKQYADEIPIWVTGHSLGGAMATLAGMRYEFESVVTFGEPRVGIHIEKEFKAKSHIRYINGDDPVTKIPPELFFDFDHHGTAVRIYDKDGSTDFKYDHSIVYYSENLA